MEYNLADLFECVVDNVPDREALVCGEARLTYAELDERANRVAHHLAAERGTGRRPRRAAALQRRRVRRSMLGCLKIRAVPVNVNYRYVAEELVYLYGDADLVALVHDAEFTARVAAARPRLPALRHLPRGRRAAGCRPERPCRTTRTRWPRRRPSATSRARSADDQLHHLHRRHHRHAQGRDVAPGGPVLRRHGRRRPDRRAGEDARGAGRAGRGAAATRDDLPGGPADARRRAAGRLHRLLPAQQVVLPPASSTRRGAAGDRAGEGHHA